MGNRLSSAVKTEAEEVRAEDEQEEIGEEAEAEAEAHQAEAEAHQAEVEEDDGAGVYPRGRSASPTAVSPPPAKRQMTTTDLSDRHIHLCAQDAILAVQRRVVGCAPPAWRARAPPAFPLASLTCACRPRARRLQMVDRQTEMHELVQPHARCHTRTQST